jgi:hypothetical protein
VTQGDDGTSGKKDIQEIERVDLEAFIEHEQDRGMHKLHIIQGSPPVWLRTGSAGGGNRLGSVSVKQPATRGKRAIAMNAVCIP